MDNNEQPGARFDSGPLPEPLYEPIGPGSGASRGEWQDDDGLQHVGRSRLTLRPAADEVLKTVRTARFWATAFAAVLGTWAAAVAAVMVLPPAAEYEGRSDAAALIYLLAAALMPAMAAFVALDGGHRSCGRALSGSSGAAAGPGVINAVAAAALKGLVLAVLVLVVLLLQAFLAGESGAVAGVSAGVSAVEGVLFGAMGAGLSAISLHARRSRVAGFLLAAFLAAGSVAAAAALLPAVRFEEPVTVALNVEWEPDGTRAAFECSPVPAGLSEVYRTERVMWLPAVSPSVIFLVLAGGADPTGAVVGWAPGALQEAADGTQVPCVNGEPKSKDEPRMPLAVVGLLLQAAVAAVLLAGGDRAAARRARVAAEEGKHEG